MGKRASFLSYLYSFGFLLLFLFTFAFTVFKNVDRQSNELSSFTSLTQTESWSEAALQFQNKPLVAGQTLSAEFAAQHSNLGTVGILFDHFDRQNTNQIQIKLIDLTTNAVVYENVSPTDKMNRAYTYTLGWPVIRESRGRQYRLELTSLDGQEQNAVGLANQPEFILKYVFPKAALMSDAGLVSELLVGKFLQIMTAFLAIPLWFYAIFVVLYFVTPLVWHKVVEEPPAILMAKLLKMVEPFFPGVMFVLTLGVALTFAALDPDMHHDGIMLKPALDVAQGKMLFRDTFTQYGALSTILQAVVLRIFGESLYNLRVFTAGVYAAIAVLAYWIGKRFLTPWQSWLSFAVWLLLAPYLFGALLPWSSVYALFFKC